jgi:hypothetical protein
VHSNYTRRFLPVLQIAGKGVEKTGVWMMSQIKVAIGAMICVKYNHQS